MKKIYTLAAATILLVNSTQAQVSKVCFKPKTSWISATNFPNDYKAVATADFNNDGLMDVVAANLGANKIEVRLGTSTGTFVVSANIGSSPTDVKAADVNNDGNKDIVSSDYDSGLNSYKIQTYLGAGDGTFGSEIVTTSAQTDKINVVDIDNDGKLDVAQILYSPSRLAFRLGDGLGNFAAPSSVINGIGYQPCFDDFNSDGFIDFVAAGSGVNVVKYHGDGAGTFTVAGTYAASSLSPYLSKSTDLNADGIKDLVVYSTGATRTITRLLGTPTGSYSAPATIASGNIGSFEVGDANGDTYPDVFCTFYGSTASSVIYFNDGINFSVNQTPESITTAQLGVGTIADLNQDGKLDLILIQDNVTNTSKLSVFIQQAIPTLSITSLNPVICAGNTTSIVATTNGAYGIFPLPSGTAYGIGTTTISISPTVTTTYDMWIFGDNNLCPFSPTATVTQSVVANNASISVNSGTYCVGSAASFTILPSGAISYTYSGGSSIVNPTSTTSYTVTGTNSVGCVATAISTVVAGATTTINAINSGTANLCIGNSTILYLGGYSGPTVSTYTWSTGSNLSLITISPTVTTTYTVFVTNSVGCSASGTVTQVVSNCSTVGISEIDNGNTISIYPNPANDFMTISLVAEPADATTIYIINALGEMVLTEKVTSSNTTLNTSNLTNGIYFVKIESKNGSAIKKFIKQ
jgi:hypothetical protein